MKKITIFLTFIVLFSNCKKKEIEEIDNEHFGSGTALLNSSTVNFNKARADKRGNNKDSISINLQYLENGIEKSGISFEILSKQINEKQNLRNNNGLSKLYSSYDTRQLDGDVVCDTYQIFESDSTNNFIQLNSFNEQSGEISGIFSGTYLRDVSLPRCNVNTVDTIRIRNGIFNTKIL